MCLSDSRLRGATRAIFFSLAIIIVSFVPVRALRRGWLAPSAIAVHG